MGKYAVRESKSKFYFNLKADNGEIILTSEGYNREASCLQGVESVRVNAPVAAVEDQTVEGFKKETNPKFEVYTDKAGEFRFRLKARNGQIIGVSEGYKAKASAIKGIESIRKNSSSDVMKVENAVKEEKAGKPAKAEAPVKAEKAVKEEKPAKAAKAEKPAKAETVEKVAKAPKKCKKA